MTDAEMRSDLDRYLTSFVVAKIGCDQSTVWRFIKGKVKTPSYDFVCRVQAFLREYDAVVARAEKKSGGSVRLTLIDAETGLRVLK